MSTGLIKQKFTTDELELYDYVIQIYCVLNHKTLPVSERTLLTYYVIGGINKDSERKFKTDFKRKSGVVYNLKNSLKRNGFLVENPKYGTLELLPFLQNKRDKMVIMLQFDASK